MKSLVWIISLVSIQWAYSQVVDKTRLEYHEDMLASPQVGMSLSSDSKLAAFLFANQKLEIFDLERSRLVKSFDIDFTDVGEIRFGADNKEIFIIERNRVRSVEWNMGEVTMDESIDEEIVCGDLSVNNELAVASVDNITIWDMNTHSKLNTIRIKENIATIFFSPKGKQMMVNPRVNMLGSKSFVYDYTSGELLRTLNKGFFGTYSTSGDRIFIHRFRKVKVKRSTAVIPVLYDLSLSNDEDSHTIYSELEKGSDVGTITTSLQMGDKLIGTAGYRGFTVYDIPNGGKVFTTKKTKRDRSASAFGFYQKYSAKAIYRLTDDLALINAYGDNKIGRA
ncbi:MAG: hypothetical protein RIA63_00200, partial [Cyclobacteriaceae bacterium]